MNTAFCKVGVPKDIRITAELFRNIGKPDGRSVQVGADDSLERFVVTFKDKDQEHTITLDVGAVVALSYLINPFVKERCARDTAKSN